VANVGAASNKFIARKIYNHRKFITVCLNVQFSNDAENVETRARMYALKKKNYLLRNNISRLRASKVSMIICGNV